MEPLTERELRLLRHARRAVLATIAGDGAPRLVPITFAVDVTHGAPLIYTPLDEKPKSVADPRDLARVHDIEARPRVSVLVDEWSEEWTSLGWLRLAGAARVLEPAGESVPEHAVAVRLLRDKYEQYATHALEPRPVIRIEVDRATSWFALP